MSIHHHRDSYSDSEFVLSEIDRNKFKLRMLTFPPDLDESEVYDNMLYNNLNKKIPFDIFLDLYGDYSVKNVFQICEKLGQYKSIKGNLTTRIAIDFVVWTIDQRDMWDIEASETIVIRIKWKTIDELIAKIHAIQNFLHVKHSRVTIPFEYNEFIMDPNELNEWSDGGLGDPAILIDENTTFSKLLI